MGWRGTLRRLEAIELLSGDLAAYAVEVTDCLAELRELGIHCRTSFTSAEVATCHAVVPPLEEVVPAQQKTLTSTGKLSTRKFTKKRRADVYQDLACGVAVRSARELLVTLPVRGVLSHVATRLLNTAIGHFELQCIVSAYFPVGPPVPRTSSLADASDFVESLRHNMSLKAGTFRPVEPLTMEAL